MSRKIQLLDCTLRDGAYIVDSEFGTPAIKGIINRLQDANVDLIECGWLKDKEHKDGTSFYHVPADMEKYIISKSERATYVVMIDWDRYHVDSLPPCDNRSVDAIRVVFPADKYREGIAVGSRIAEKGYQVYFQAANTLAYSDGDLISLAKCINEAHPVCLSVVDTFGAMFAEDLTHIVELLDKHLDKDIKLGFHSHNNQQLSFAMSMHFVELLQGSERACVVDSSLCGMGRGAGNTTTELLANYLNTKQHGNYDLNVILDAIDTYMRYFLEKYSWGYSTPYFISGMYGAHVNNISYLQNTHRANAKDLKNIISLLSEKERTKYDYDLLERKYMDYQSKDIDDKQALSELREKFKGRKVLLILAGKSIVREKKRIDGYIKEHHPIVIGVNAVNEGFGYDYLFFSNPVRYHYAKEIYSKVFHATTKLVTSNITTHAGEDEILLNFNLLIKRGWAGYDNSGIMCLQLMDKVHAGSVALAGLDGFEKDYAKSYADSALWHDNPGDNWKKMNEEIQGMFTDFKNSTAPNMEVVLITKSKFV